MSHIIDTMFYDRDGEYHEIRFEGGSYCNHSYFDDIAFLNLPNAHPPTCFLCIVAKTIEDANIIKKSQR
jgi:hypothetical protein